MNIKDGRLDMDVSRQNSCVERGTRQITRNERMIEEHERRAEIEATQKGKRPPKK